MSNLYFCAFFKSINIYTPDNNILAMGASLYFFVVIMFLFIGVVIMVARSNDSENFYRDLDIDEWDCHECGFHVQVGNICIYCNAKKQK
jgi:hypothetical protein